MLHSNAALQWVTNHDRLIPGLGDMVTEGGALAAQLPANKDSPLHNSLRKVAEATPFRSYTSGCDKLLTYHSAGYYYDLLCEFAREVDLWETTYYHEMASPRDLIEWYKSTGMKPYLQHLPNDRMKKTFEEDILDDCRKYYPLQKNRMVLYPFKRLFFIAYK